MGRLSAFALSASALSASALSNVAAAAPPWPEPARYRLAARTLLTVDRWYGARPTPVERNDVRQRLQLDVYSRPPRRPSDYRVDFYSDLEIGADFGPTPEVLGQVVDSRRPELDLYVAYLLVTGPLLDARFGRHTLMDAAGMDAVDGASVKLRPVPHLELGGTAGLAVRRGWSEVGPDLFSPDGTRLSDAPGLLTSVTLGTRDLERLHLQAAWRREADAAVQRDLLAVAGVGRPLADTDLDAGLRYDRIFARLAELRAGVVQRLGPARLRLGWRFDRPLFSADSIWNAFSMEPYHAVGGAMSVATGEWVATVDGEGRRFDGGDEDAQAPGVAAADRAGERASVDGAGGARWSREVGLRVVRRLELRHGPGDVGFDARLAGGYGGERQYGSTFTTLPLPLRPANEPLQIRARLGAVRAGEVVRSDSPTVAGWSLLALGWQASETIRIEALGEGHASTWTPWRMRALAQITVEDWW